MSTLGFRCWYCERLYRVEGSAAGEVRRCGCGSKYRVPRANGGDSRYRTLTDRLVEAVVYGGGGAIIGFGLSLLVLRLFFITRSGYGFALQLILVCTVGGLLAGLLLGEAGITMLGRWARAREGDEERWL